MNLEILARDIIILRAQGTISMAFKIVRDMLIIRGLVEARVAFWIFGPALQRIPVTTLQYLVISQFALHQSWH